MYQQGSVETGDQKRSAGDGLSQSQDNVEEKEDEDNEEEEEGRSGKEIPFQ